MRHTKRNTRNKKRFKNETNNAADWQNCERISGVKRCVYVQQRNQREPQTILTVFDVFWVQMLCGRSLNVWLSLYYCPRFSNMALQHV